jgi:hypothetical protein
MMITRENGMSDDRRESPSDKAVLGVCELLGLVFALPFGDDLFRGTPITAVPFAHYVYLGIGVLWAAIGPLWPTMRRRFPHSIFVSTLGRAALDARTWIFVLLIAFVYLTIPAPPSAVEIATAVARALSNSTSASSAADEQSRQLREAQSQRDQAIQERNSANQRLAALGAATPNPLHSDGIKWKLTSGLAFVIHDKEIIKKCKIIINKEQTPYSETYAQDLKDILNVLNWQFDEMVSDSPLPRGLSITAVNQQPAQECAQMFSQRLSSDLKWHGAPLAVQVRWAMPNNIPSHLFTCGGGCVEIEIGNDPD